MGIIPSGMENFHLKCVPDPETDKLCLEHLLKVDFTNLLYTLAAGLAIIMIIWGAYQYLTAYGNEERAEQGKKIILWTLIGVIVIILASLIVKTVTGILIISPTPTSAVPGTQTSYLIISPR